MSILDTGRRTAAPSASHLDAELWPDIVTVPGNRTRAWVAQRLFERVVRKLALHVLLPDGRALGAGGLSGPVLRLRRPEAFYQRIGSSGLVGFGEAYMAGDWETDDLVGVLEAIASRVATLIPLPLQRLRHAYLVRSPRHESNTVRQAKDNIARHYDLSNDMFAAFLDETMTYSSAVFSSVIPEDAVDDTLESAQLRKIDRLLDLAKVGPGTRLLEIGTGWGELACRAGQRGATVKSVTISEEQANLARTRIDAAGLSSSVEVDLLDYRLVRGEFDAIISVEMIEAVGLDHLAEYVSTLDRLLAPGGHIALQAITMPHDRMVASQDTYTWIRKYIFPGGQILSVQAIEDALTTNTSLRVAAKASFGLHYAETLKRWRTTFLANRSQIGALGFDEVFSRMWSFYLAYSEAGFRARYLDVHQLLLTSSRSAPAAA